MKNAKNDTKGLTFKSSLFTKTIWNTALAALTIIALLPILWMASSAFKPAREMFAAGISFPFEDVTLQHFRHLWNEFAVARILINTFVIATSITFLQLVSSLLAAYGFTRYDFPFKKMLFYICILTMFIPLQVVMVSNYLLVANWGLLNSYLGVILPQGVNAFGTFLLYQHLRVFPEALIDAARIDGASELVILFRVVLPIIRPVLAALAVILFINGWNQYVWPNLILSNPDDMTLPIWLRHFMHEEAGARWGLLMAASFSGVIPALAVYYIAHSKIMSAFMSMGLKG